MTTLLREHDPAADADPSAASHAAAAMLADILATPRAHASRPRNLVRGGALVGTAAAISLALPVFWPGGDNPSAAAAYTVDRNRDGSVDVAISFQDFRDPAALQRALDEQGVPAVVLSGPGLTMHIGPDGSVGTVTIPDCAQYRSLGTDPGASPDDPNQPVSYIDSALFQDTGLRLRPDLLPANGSFVIDIVQSGGEIEGISGDVAIGTPPTCPKWIVAQRDASS
jgi:hypothetical protein